MQAWRRVRRSQFVFAIVWFLLPYMEPAIVAWKKFRVYIPNILSTTRLFAPVYLWPLFSAGYGMTFLGLAVASASTDWLDGRLAKRWGCQTPGGAMMDIYADKFLCMTLVATSVTARHNTASYMALVAPLVLYHIVVIFRRAMGRAEFKSSYVAKVKMMVEMTGLITSLWSSSNMWHIEALDNFVDMFSIAELSLAACILAPWSMAHYLGYAPDLSIRKRLPA